jgi:DNA polymerase-3 subunit epsilon
MASRVARLWRRLTARSQLLPAIATDHIHFVVLDVETTGLAAGAELLEIGAVRMTGPRILVGPTFEQLIRPAQPNWPASTPVHRILPTDVTAAPTLAEALAAFADFCAGAVLVGHQVAVDRAFLTRPGHPGAARLAGRLWFDVQQAAHRLGMSQATLAALAEHYHIPLPRRHHALTDAFITAQIWQRQLHQFKANGIDSLPALAKVVQI